MALGAKSELASERPVLQPQLATASVAEELLESEGEWNDLGADPQFNPPPLDTHIIIEHPKYGTHWWPKEVSERVYHAKLKKFGLRPSPLRKEAFVKMAEALDDPIGAKLLEYGLTYGWGGGNWDVPPKHIDLQDGQPTEDDMATAFAEIKKGQAIGVVSQAFDEIPDDEIFQPPTRISPYYCIPKPDGTFRFGGGNWVKLSLETHQA